MRIFFKTFGCRVNQYETQALRERLLADGDSVAVFDFESADVCLINTCAVTREADKDALTLLRRIRRRNPGARLLVAGCLATRSREEVLRAAPAAVIVANGDRDRIPLLLGLRGGEGFGITGFPERSRALLKIQDGCNMRCSYCVVPSVRPKLSCKDVCELEREFRRLLANGYQELVLCGIRLGRYLSQDASGRRVDLVSLLERLAGLSGDFRIRLSSLEVTDVTPRLLDLFASRDPKLAPSFHLPLQSGCDKTLRAMGRWYSAGLYARRVAALRERLPEAGVFSDVMVGFPGETDGDFERSLDFVRRIAFSGLHVFRYSPRPGTPAASRPPVGAEAARERAAAMRELDRQLRARFALENLGARRRVLVEDGGEGVAENFLRVRFDRDPGPGLVPVRIFAAKGPLALACAAAG